MLNNILKIEGAQGLSSIEQKEVKGGAGSLSSVTIGYCREFQWIIRQYIRGNRSMLGYIVRHEAQYHACRRKGWIGWL
jgi:hypothetical protein